MAKFSLYRAENTRIKLTKQQQKQVAKIYREAAKSIGKRADSLPRTPSSPLYKSVLIKLQREILQNLEKTEMGLKGTIEDNMRKVSQSVVESNESFLKRVRLSIFGAYGFVPEDIVSMVSSGKLYSGNWSLSRALWKNHIHTRNNINNIIAQGVAENKSAYDIAKDLEKYLNPSARKDWDWSKVYPGTSKRVDYNAQRLARTMVSHAYQQSFIRVTKNNPFVEDYIWHSAGGSRTCEICSSRDGVHFKKDELPLDHPNGMCTYEAYIPDDMTVIADRLADWVEGKADTEIDRWMKDMEG